MEARRALMQSNIDLRRDIGAQADETRREAIEAQRQNALAIAEARKEASRLAHEARLESIEQRREAQKSREQLGSMLTETSRERAMRPEDQVIVMNQIARIASERGLNRLPYAQSKRAWEQLAADFGMELTGIPTIGYVKGEGDWFGAQTPILSGSFSLRPKPLTTRSERNRGGRPGTQEDPLGIR
jgi:hypothetical protein